ncbi:glycine-rich RNA-binding protein 3, mitochondrial-like [Trifolium pratense]|uniref:glycine-rich RNA-binding protein 3, mitochondrial-like n=1 Tax=Trifolium pratense TaxID=57577 RepID=UPI001E6907E7|nr:glycine-rich RNA-binding protein 3, mitochondrial-like [Trifolium pratense]
MAFFGRFTNLLKHQYVRGMSSAPNTKLMIGGFSRSTNEQSLREAFSKYGEITDARITMNLKTGKRRGFITYNSVEEASIALQASDGRDLHGRQVQVNYVDVRPHEGRPTGVYKLPVPSPPAVDLVSDQGKI